MKNNNWLRALKAAFPYSLPIMAGYLILGAGFGLLLQSKGYSILWAFLMSVFIYAGSGQYVAVDLLSSGASLISSALIILMVNARHLFYGIAMLIRYRDMGKVKPYLIFGLTDECFGVVSHVDPPEGVNRRLFYFIFTLLNQIYWIAGSVLGAAFGTVFPIDTTGVEFSMTAIFIVIVTDNLMKKGSRITSFIGIGCALVCLLIFGAENFLIPSMLAIAIVLTVFKPLLWKDGPRNEANGAAPMDEACEPGLKDEVSEAALRDEANDAALMDENDVAAPMDEACEQGLKDEVSEAALRDEANGAAPMDEAYEPGLKDEVSEAAFRDEDDGASLSDKTRESAPQEESDIPEGENR